MQTNGKDSKYLKNRNRALVLELLATKQADSRIALSKMTGLSKMSLTNIINDFVNVGLVEEAGSKNTKRTGRKPQLLVPVPDGPLIAGIYIARNYLYGLLCDIRLKVSKHKTVALCNETRRSFVSKLEELCDELLCAAHVWEIGVASIGPVDTDNGVILSPYDFYGISDLNIKQLLSERYNLPVYVENDMNAAALAELHYGAGKKHNSFLYLGLTNGVGSGMISERKLYRSEMGLGGEFGHIGVDLYGEPCPCGRRGCVERYTSIPVLCRKMYEATGKDYSFEQYCMMNDTRIDDILSDAIEKLAYALTSHVNMFNPEIVILGHEASFLPERYITVLSECVNHSKLWGNFRDIFFTVAYFGKMSPAFGAVCVVLERWFSGHLPVQLEYAQTKEI